MPLLVDNPTVLAGRWPGIHQPGRATECGKIDPGDKHLIELRIDEREAAQSSKG